jgi:hypothetical protein
MNKTEALELISKITERVNKVGEEAFLKRVFPDNTLVTDIFKTYRKIFNKEWNVTCRSCYFDCYAALYELTLTNNKTLENMEKLLYYLPKGRLLLDIKEPSKNCTNKNITNELAEWHLKRDPAKIKWFSKFPEDWQERCQLVKDEPVKGEIEVKEKAKEEVKATVIVNYPTRKVMLADLKVLTEAGKLEKDPKLALKTNEEIQKIWLDNKK